VVIDIAPIAFRRVAIFNVFAALATKWHAQRITNQAVKTHFLALQNSRLGFQPAMIKMFQLQVSTRRVTGFENRTLVIRALWQDKRYASLYWPSRSGKIGRRISQHKDTLP
jgi:hypothetical protein